MAEEIAPQVNIHRALVDDKRTVTILLSGAPEHRTPAGKTPIDPRRVDITMWVSPWSPELRTSIEIAGVPTRDGSSKQGLITRRFSGPDAAGAPEWALRLAEQHRPQFGEVSRGE